MNEQIRELVRKAIIDVDYIRDDDFTNEELSKMYIPDCFAEKFAELIVRECIYTIQRKIVRNGNTPENIRSRQHINDLGNKFGITFPMDYFGVEE